jgi:quercetin dioxygenase-like cupin family protein
VLFCYAGEGWAEVDGQRHEVRPETTLLIGRAAWHTVQNTGSTQMRLLWMIAPADGLITTPHFAVVSQLF